MFSPDELRKKLARQWDNAKLRAGRLLPPGNWPLCLPVGKPSARMFAEQTQCVLQHVQLWRQVAVGRVEWEEVSYRASDTPVLMPLRWILNGPSDWINAAADPAVSQEFRLLEGIIEHVDPIFHPLLVSHRSLWRHKDPQDIINAASLACRLAPGCAKGLPLRLLSGQGVDTKFIENNISLLTRLLDVRFSGEASEQGLSTFLDAFDESSHWVLVVPLSPGLLPFKKCRVTTTELAATTLPVSRVLVIENEQCLHQLPALSDTIAILGCGLDVQWLSSSVLDEKRVAYWGDMDSWGLLMLARARLCRPTLDVLLMNRELFEQYASHSAVTEPVKAQEVIPDGLLPEEADFYRYLTSLSCGRLEQEFLPVDVVRVGLENWFKLYRP
ncbi:hypothetical protein C0Z46_11740 [Salmonella enterica]|uniref:DUF3322 and DUF2220 domain-containing protein n=1 Tax=Salmonella enterica subsp. enterica serovar Panama TaxID=29472 RepID=A0A5U8JHX1_SALET|nr:DUF3322 domain-containing protein [Salmonella enterica]EAA8760208.1 hypothetical protein [Salmonella enterica subsp. enterica serovar Rubislaw]EBR7996955.1 hypothetical protein [Salmonella enterica subsp. enterica serovar Panama]ASD89698.1 hypothetical protein LFZ16_27760 [Salmonella enterica subsp. enterica serovar India str. SA20085604]EAO9158109.1 hypothetical protein [Salmonella enterica]EBR8436161.1 hypothetical protein [Salmonella enterica subsp. enterica serovar Panama]